MKVLKYLAIGIVALVVLFVGGSQFLPAKFQMSRSTTIKAPAKTVFAQVNNLENYQKWSPWNSEDPTVKEKLS